MKRIKHFLYWLRTHTYNRYHMLDMRCPRNGYKWGWRDRSDLFIYANFALLVAFVEREYPGHVDWEYDEGHRATRDEFLLLYKWWIIERKEEHDTCDALLAKIFDRRIVDELASREEIDACAKASDAIEARDDEMLHRLLAVRGALWS